MSTEPQLWLRHLRQRHEMTIDQLAEAAGLSKVFLSKIERGERGASAKSKQQIAAALDEPEQDVFPVDGRRSPEDAATYYLESIRARRNADPTAGVPEAEFEQDCRAHGLDPDEERAGTDAVWFADDDTLVIDGRRFHEEIRAIHVEIPPMLVTGLPPRPQERRRRTRASRKTKGSASSDDPGEDEPAGGRQHSRDFVGDGTTERGLEHAGAVLGQQAVSRAARSRKGEK